MRAVEFITENLEENFADGKVKGKSSPGRVKRAGASCKGSITHLRKMDRTCKDRQSSRR